MRLAQLARKLEVRSAEIVEILAQANLPIDNHSNSKLTNEQLDIALRYFGKSADKEVMLVERVEDELEVTTETPEPGPEPEKTPEPERHEQAESALQSDREVIKPVKVALQGLKVVGKIDLPEPKKKPSTEENAAQDQPTDAEIKKRDGGRTTKRNSARQPYTNKPRKNPIALEREREEREALRKKLEQQKKEKEIRTQNYFKKLQGASPPKKSSRKKKSAEQFETLDNFASRPEPPKTLLGKIWRWLKPPSDY